MILIVRKSATKDVVSRTYYSTKGNNTNDPHDKAKRLFHVLTGMQCIP